MQPYPVGKLPAEAMAALLASIPQADPRVVLGPGIGHDAAVIDFGDRYLVTKSDPITFATDEIGWYAVQVNANDVACLGAAPRWFVAAILLPEGRSDHALAASIFRQMTDACAEMGATLVGGHTEITHGLDRPIVVGAMLGEVARERLVRSDGARPGDALILTKRIAVEGTAIIARELGERLRGSLPEALLRRAAAFLHEPGIGIVREAAILTDTGHVHAMHDPTEGGVAGGLWELCAAAGVGAVVEAEALPFYAETRAICEVLGLDPLGLIASGSLLAAVEAEAAEAVLTALHAAGIEATRIGTVTAEADLLLRERDGRLRPFPRFARDEIARLFGGEG